MEKQLLCPRVMPICEYCTLFPCRQDSFIKYFILSTNRIGCTLCPSPPHPHPHHQQPAFLYFPTVPRARKKKKQHGGLGKQGCHYGLLPHSADFHGLNATETSSGTDEKGLKVEDFTCRQGRTAEDRRGSQALHAGSCSLLGRPGAVRSGRGGGAACWEP